MTFEETSEVHPKYYKKLMNLWKEEFPMAILHENEAEFHDYLKEREKPRHVFVRNDQNEIVGWFFDFDRREERWFGMILHFSVQVKGVGTRLLDDAKSRYDRLNGWIIDHDNDIKFNKEVYWSPIEFYKKQGFKETEERLENERISAVKMIWEKS